MRKYLPILLAMVIGLAGCVTQTPKPQPPDPNMPPMPPGLPTASMSVMPRGVLKAAALPPLKLAPVGSAFFDDFLVTPNTQWGFYQGARAFTNGVLRLTAASNAGMYAWPLSGNWTNVSVSADVKMAVNSWGAGVGARLNTNNGVNYQAWIYVSGRMTIEKYPTDWYSGWQELGAATIPALGTTTNNVKLTISNNVVTAYLNGVQKITYTDTSPITGGGKACLGIWGSGGHTTVADYDNVTVYNLDAVPTVAPVIVTGLVDTVGLKGLSTTLSVTATGNPLTYRWTLPNKTLVVGSNTYTISDVQTPGKYSVSVSNALGKVTSTAYLSVGTTNTLTNCVVAASSMGTVHLEWCPSPSTNTVITYRVYYGSGTVTNWVSNVYDWGTNPPCTGVLVQRGSNWCRCYTNATVVGTNVIATVTNLVPGATYYFAVTANDSLGLESDYSDEVSYVNPLSMSNPPTNAVLTITSLGGGAIQLQSKICPNELATVWYAKKLNQPWSVLASNIVADVYGNFFYKNGAPTDQMRFYKLQPK